MSRYAENTTVPSDRSRAEIEATLRRYQATAFAYGWDDDDRVALVGFKMHGRQIRFRLPMPDKAARRFTHTEGRGLARSADAQAAEYEKAVRQSWRALALVIKAKLEAVEANITTLDDEFMAHVVLPNGATVGEWMAPQIEAAYSEGRMPALLSGMKAITKGGAS